MKSTISLKKSLMSCAMAFIALTATAQADIKDIVVDKTDTKVVVSLLADFSKAKIPSDNEIVVSPLLTDGANKLSLPEIVVAGRNRRIRNERTGIYEDQQALQYTTKQASKPITYNVVVDAEPWMQNCELVIRQRDCGCNGTNPLEANTQIVTVLLEAPSTEFMAFIPDFIFVAPKVENEKYRDMHGSAFITFPVNKTVIYPEYRNNVLELLKITSLIDSVKSDEDMTITNVSIKGFASPEGSYEINRRLAIGRTDALKKYIDNLYSFNKNMVSTSYEPENWEGLIEWLKVSNIENKQQILAIAQSDMAPDLRDNTIKTKYPQQYQMLLNNVYPTLRRSDYIVKYRVRNFTDLNKIGQLLRTAPNKLSLHEIFLYANTLDPESPEYANAFEIAALLFPTDAIANLNAANCAMDRGNYPLALDYLNNAGDSAQAIYAKGVLNALQGNYSEARNLFAKADEMGIPQAKDALQQIYLIEQINL